MDDFGTPHVVYQNHDDGLSKTRKKNMEPINISILPEVNVAKLIWSDLRLDNGVFVWNYCKRSCWGLKVKMLTQADDSPVKVPSH